ncbi:YraN family protein [Thermosulfurimonas sp. F29]|uniref:YraN family protein n=1 Tax=Thermosulfurimonas sp. F29 TaxID=2867247 RepID=UPI001C830335|nr:YraN family protein [Thermosulfurimonas sp. F29]MBX6422463.1 YraN family protein [Thermosulfurimonas sp. F29]
MAPVRYIAELFARFARSGNPKDFGRRAEKLAEEYLRFKGYRILCRNWRTRFGEIDLVVQKDDTLVFVEVKARRSRRKGRPEEALTPAKKTRLLTLARCYLSSFKGRVGRVRFDVLALDFSGKIPDIRHFEGVIEDG